MINIVGAGFSGLTLAYYLSQHGMKVRLFEKGKHPGGLISTKKTPHGLIETAANAMLANAQVEELFDDLKLKFAEPGKQRHRRYIYWEQPKRWPLTMKTSWLVARQGCKWLMGHSEMMPESGESIEQWCDRVMNQEFQERLLAPALQGIYGGDPRQLSAKLVLRSLTRKKDERGELSGSVAPEFGMGQLIERLVIHLVTKGVELNLQTTYEIPAELKEPHVLCTSAPNAATLLQKLAPNVSQVLSTCEMLPLVSVTCFFDRREDDLEGFGCLFPQSQGFHSLGVLFNDCIFEGRSTMRSETWIMGGALNPGIIAFPSEQILQMILTDREKLTGHSDRPFEHSVTAWSRALPHYTVEWEKTLKQIQLAPPLFLHGNYLGSLGLTRLLGQSKELADRLKELYG